MRSLSDVRAAGCKVDEAEDAWKGGSTKPNHAEQVEDCKEGQATSCQRCANSQTSLSAFPSANACGAHEKWLGWDCCATTGILQQDHAGSSPSGRLCTSTRIIVLGACVKRLTSTSRAEDKVRTHPCLLMSDHPGAERRWHQPLLFAMHDGFGIEGQPRIADGPGRGGRSDERMKGK